MREIHIVLFSHYFQQCQIYRYVFFVACCCGLEACTNLLLISANGSLCVL
jgi:hypothetical protein